MTTRPVAWATDAAYVRHAAASVHSVLSHDLAAEPHLLIAPDVPEEDVRAFHMMVGAAGRELHVHRIGDQVVDLPVMDRIGPVMWYRVLLPELLPTARRVLYLDADTVVRRDLAPLFDLALDGAAVAAVDNVTEPSQLARLSELGISDEHPYFNSGVLMFDLDVMRGGRLSGAILEVARGRRLTWPDQDALNIVLGPRRHPLHPRWNCQNSLLVWRDWADERFGSKTVSEALTDPAIVHFEGPGIVKPWHVACAHPRQQEYLGHAAATPWGAPRLRSGGFHRRAGRRLRSWLRR